MMTEKELFFYIFIGWAVVGLVLAFGAFRDYCRIRKERQIQNQLMVGGIKDEDE